MARFAPRGIALPALLAMPAASTALALAPVRRPFPLAVAGWVVALPALELPLHTATLVAGSTWPLRRRPRSAAERVGLGLAATTLAGLAVVLARQFAAGPALDRAVAEGMGPGRDGAADREGSTAVLRRPTTWTTVVLRPWPGRPRGIRARRGMSYGPDPVANRFDLYTRRDTDEACGVLVHIHGGHFRAGAPSRESREMIFDHARRGWAAISTTYHLSDTPESGFPEHLIDIKRLLHWIRREGPAHGIPHGGPVVLAGSSAGAHIAMMAALTPGDPAFQPGFEQADTWVDGVIGLYGYYGPLGPTTRDVSYPKRRPAQSAPLVVVVHGTSDSYTPVTAARRLVEHLRAGSSRPVVYAELPGTQHGFDAVRSPRYLAVVAAIARVTDTLV